MQQGESETARVYLDEALEYAVAGGYRLYEADIRVALAWTHHAIAAHVQAERARRMSDEMGYYWGQVDAKKVMTAIKA